MSEPGAYFGGLSEGLRQGREGAQHTFGNYYYENTRMWWTTRDGQGCHHLPPTTAVLWGVTHFLASTESNTMSALGTRISLETFKRNSRQPSELTCVTLVRARKPVKLTPTKQERGLKLN